MKKKENVCLTFILGTELILIVDKYFILTSDNSELSKSIKSFILELKLQKQQLMRIHNSRTKMMQFVKVQMPAKSHI